MKYFAVLSAIIFCCYLLGFIKKTDKNLDFMSRRFTDILKGFSILTIVWAHSGAKFGVGGIQFIAGVGVSLFLICSGYGLECSYQKNGLSLFWKKRVLNVAVPFWTVELLGLLVIGNFAFGKYILDFFFLKPATGYGWFMGYILACYVFFWFVKYMAKKFNLKENQEMLLLILLFMLLFIFESTVSVNADMPFLKARQVLSFPVGVLIAKKKNEVESIIRNKSALLIGGV